MIKGFDFSSKDINNAISENKLLLLNLFTPNKCNLKCPYCFTSQWTSKKKTLSIAEYKNIITQAKELGAKSIWWVGEGEPFLYEYFTDLVDHITNEGLWVGIFTNGTLISKKMATFLKRRNVSLYVKKNSFTPEVQDELVGNISGTFERINESINNLLEVNFNKDNRLVIESVITKLNYNEIPELYRWCRKNDITPFIEMLEHATPQAKELDVDIKKHLELFKKIQNIDKKEFSIEWNPSPPWVGIKCRNLYISITIDSQGNIQPCSGLHISKGKINDKPLKHWWNHSFYKKFRNPQFVEPDYSNNKSLGNYGCKSHAFHCSGKIDSADPRLKQFCENV